MRVAASGASLHNAPQPPQLERGIPFDLGPSFYRPQSCFSRDLAALSAVVHRRARHAQQQAAAPAPAAPGLDVLDLMAGSGIRSARYLLHADADSVLCNEGDRENAPSLQDNLSWAAAQAAAGAGVHGDNLNSWAWEAAGRRRRVDLVHEEAVSLLLRCRLEGRRFDLIDSDSFGAAAHCVGAALDAVRWGGLLCLTHTAGTVAGGRDPDAALALYCQHLSPVPHANEQGLRLLLGLAWREAAARRLSLTPLWSLYAPHGPVWRTMLLVDRERLQPAQQRRRQRRLFGYTLHHPRSGESACCPFHDLTHSLMAADDGAGRQLAAGPPLLSGPLWLGPLHDAAHLRGVRAEAMARGWLAEPGVAGAAGSGQHPHIPFTRKGSTASLSQLLELLVEEAEAEAEAAEEAAAGRGGEGGLPPGLPPWYLRTADVGRVGRLVGPPSRQALIAELRRRGFVAARSHVDPSGIRTTASMAQAVAAAVQGLGIASRARPEE